MLPVLPTLLTLGNAVCGFGAITLAARGWGADPATSLAAASGLIFLAMAFDAIDGSVARWANQTSEFGAHLDSLSDAISFGAAPALLMLQFSLPHGHPPGLLWAVAAVYVSCAVLRLARFNAESGEGNPPPFFCGLPSPAAAGTVASFPLMVFGLKYLGYTGQDIGWGEFALWFDSVAVGALPFITFAVAGLMVSRVRYAHTFRQPVRGRRGGPQLVKLALAAGVIVVAPQLSAPLVFCWYAFATPVKGLWTKMN